MNPVATPTPDTTPTLVSYPPPLHLKHQAVVMLPYEAFDGPHARDTDAKYLSLGRAQWNDDEVSAKVWRFPDHKWSRLSEELPLHRLVDLCILTVKVLLEDQGRVVIPSGTFENQTEPVELARLADLPEDFEEQSERLRQRLRKLREVLEASTL